MEDMAQSKMHFFDKQLAKKYGVDEAIMLNHLIYWIATNNMNGKNRHDKRTWTYNPINAFIQYMPYWSEAQIRRVLNSLEKQEVIISGNFNKHKYDRTKWYALNDEEYFMKKHNPVDRMNKWSRRY